MRSNDVGMSSSDSTDIEKKIIEARRKLGDRIRDLRKECGKGQDEFAFMAGIHRTHIGSIENAKIDPRHSTLYKIADAFGITLEELFED